MNVVISQVIGCAYTYRPSQGVRNVFSKDRMDHSSHQGKNAFSYFRKVDSINDIVDDNQTLILRSHPKTNAITDHWYEPELAILLGENHSIIGYSLANDLTASTVEFEPSTPDYDPTYYGKCWKGSCGLKLKFHKPEEIGELDNIEICLRIYRKDTVIYDNSYSISQRLREFVDFPSLIFKRLSDFTNIIPESKKILIDRYGFLHFGTILLTGTGLIIPKRCYAQDNDFVTVYSKQLGTLSNKVELQRE